VAQQCIERGNVLVAGATADKATRLVAPGEPIRILGPPARFVSRAGFKLLGALERFQIDPRGWHVLDAGASTGGFTDCLLQHGAADVVAVDVGHGQLHERLRADARVTCVERCNIRTSLTPEIVGRPVDAVVADLSFISLRMVLDPLLAVCAPQATLVVLVKPQFEAGRAEVSRGRGIVRSPEIWRRILNEVIAALEAREATIMGVMASPITGTDGNVEFIVHAHAPAEVPSAPPPASSTAPMPSAGSVSMITAAVAEASDR
jgi:23S rRNA (cytidine1920-2'-O)/16S rRNA (cytidine1409-2'-O)-methyltransferase